jgi:hypothetical protein
MRAFSAAFYFAPNELNAIKVALILFDVQISRCANILGLESVGAFKPSLACDDTFELTVSVILEMCCKSDRVLYV